MDIDTVLCPQHSAEHLEIGAVLSRRLNPGLRPCSQLLLDKDDHLPRMTLIFHTLRDIKEGN